MFGYKCNLLTDTEVITYIIDYLHRRLGMPLDDVAKVIAAPFWSELESGRFSRRKRRRYAISETFIPACSSQDPFQ